LKSSWIIAGWITALVFAVGLSAANLYLGDLNQDEGWYLYAPSQVAAGKLPYRDFAFTQAPVLPFVYAAGYPLIRAFGVGGGRFITVLFGLAAALLAAGTAFRTAPKSWRALAGLTAFILTAVNVYQSYFTTIVKTYALCAFFLMAGLYALTWIARRQGAWACVLAGLCGALAAGTRLSAGAVLPVVFLYLLRHHRRWGWTRWFCYGAGGGLGLLGVFLPMYLIAPQGFMFGVVQYHTLRDPGSFIYQMVLKAGFISRYVQAYFVASVLMVLLPALYLVFRKRFAAAGEQGLLSDDTVPENAWADGAEADTPEPSDDDSEKPVASEEDRPGAAVFWWVWAAISLVHLSAPFPYDDYQVIVYPVLGTAIAVVLVQCLSRLTAGATVSVRCRVAGVVLPAVLLSCMAASLSSPVNQSWMIRGRDRIWWLMKDKPDLVKLQEAGRWIRARTRPGDLLLTQDTYLAVEARRDVPDALALGPFSYYPDWPTEKARRLNLLNRERMLELIAHTPAPFAAVSGYGLAIRCPAVRELTDEEQDELWQAVRQRYQVVRTIEAFGQAHTTLRILRQRTGTGSSDS
jgi:hypothetical protein